MVKSTVCEDTDGSEKCPIVSAISLIGGKWKLPVLYHLREQTLRFNEIKKLLPRVTQKMLTQQLRELERDGLISRKVYAEVPPRVEYTITPIARKLEPILASLCAWGMEYSGIDPATIAAEMAKCDKAEMTDFRKVG